MAIEDIIANMGRSPSFGQRATNMLGLAAGVEKMKEYRRQQQMNEKVKGLLAKGGGVSELLKIGALPQAKIMNDINQQSLIAKKLAMDVQNAQARQELRKLIAKGKPGNEPVQEGPPSPVEYQNRQDNYENELMGLLAQIAPQQIASSLFDKEGSESVQIVRGEDLGLPGGFYKVKIGKDGAKDIVSLSSPYASIRVTPPNQFGEVSIIDLRTNKVKTIAPEKKIQPSIKDTGIDTDSTTKFEEAAREGTGPFAAIKAGISNIFGPIVSGRMFPETQDSREAIRLFNQEIKTGLVNSDKFPKWEQEIVQDLLPDPDKLFTDPDDQSARARKLIEWMKDKRQENKKLLDSRDITKIKRRELNDQLIVIDRLLGLVETDKKPSRTDLEKKYGVTLE